MTPRAKTTRKPPIVLTDARTIKALSHPARIAVLDDLFAGRELTATEAAEIAGVTPSAMSYHLRALEKAGIVERVETSSDGRERPWRATGSGLRIDEDESPVKSAATAVLAQEFLNRVGRDLSAWTAQRRVEPDERWREIGGLSFANIWLTIDEAEELASALESVIDRARARTVEDRPEGSRRVRVASVLFPRAER